MQVLCVSDMVVPELERDLQSGRLPMPDLVISCGDLPPEYLSSLRNACQAPLYYVRGNHDLRYTEKPPMGCANLHGRILRHGSLRLMGFEGSRWYNGGPVQYTESQMRWKVWRRLPRLWLKKGVDIIVTHAPPRRIHDAEDPCHRGFIVYRKLIQWFGPRYFLHGHIHAHFSNASQRSTYEGGTQVINCFGHCRIDIDADSLV